MWTEALPSMRKEEEEGIPLRAACGTPTPGTPTPGTTARSSENGCSSEGSKLLPEVGLRWHGADPEAEVGARLCLGKGGLARDGEVREWQSGNGGLDALGGGHVSGDGVGPLSSTALREGGGMVEENRKMSKMAGPGGK